MIKPHCRNGQAFKGLTIGLLGGSFNPAHDGHLAMSLEALKQLGLDQVWWLVSPQNPLKTSSDMAPLERRAASAARLAATHPRLIVTSLETALGTRYTAHSLQKIIQRFPHTRFVWLMGADNVRQIPRWKNWQKIFHLVPVAIFHRPGYLAGRGMGKAAIRFGKSVQTASKGKIIARGVQKDLPAWMFLDNKLNYSSATKIRKDNPAWQK